MVWLVYLPWLYLRGPMMCIEGYILTGQIYSNSTVIDQSNVGFTLVWLSCAKSEIGTWLVNSSTAGTQIDTAMAL